MQYERKSFSVSVRSAGADDEDFARRWEETFGPKKKKDEQPGVDRELSGDELDLVQFQDGYVYRVEQ